MLREYLHRICLKTNINPIMKVTIIKSLCLYDENDIIGYETLNTIYPTIEKDIPTPCKVELIKLLMQKSEYEKQVTKYFTQLVNNGKIDCQYRYNIILSIDAKKYKNIVKEICINFIEKKNMTEYKILASQNLLQNFNLTKNQRDDIEKLLLSFSTDTQLCYNLRSDSADILLRLGSIKNKEFAKDIIMLLGQQGVTVNTIYDNAENVHVTDIDESAIEIIEYLFRFVPTMTVKTASEEKEEKVREKFIRGNEITFDYVKGRILKLIEKEKRQLGLKKSDKFEKEELIKVSLNRINMDRVLYTCYNRTLSSILIKVWSYIDKNEKNKKELIKRLLEELVEMSGICSSGHITRLANTLTGFGDFSLKISWRDQITANLGGRLNARARNIDDIEFQEEVLTEMSISPKYPHLRKNFLKFFRENVLSIRDEMYQEFKTHIDDATFDLEFRQAISKYEYGSFV